MKKAFFGCIPLLILIMNCGGSPKPIVSTPTGSSVLTLDQAIREAALEIDNKLSEKIRIAPVNFNSATDIFSAYVLDEITANLVNSGHLTVVDRTEIELRRNELNFQMSGEVSDETMQGLGRTLGAQSIVTGSLTAVSGTYRIVIRVLNVESGRVEVMYRNDIANDNRVSSLLRGNVIEEKAYRIGDFGPAGGFVFYDKGVFSNGWRYLEVAPVETEIFAAWGEDVLVGGLNLAVGSGKQNTQKIINKMEQLKISWSAAQLCANINYDGYNDWFLPSRDELELVYKNIKQKGLGGFEGTYWYSSERSAEYAYRINFHNGDREDYYVKSIDDMVKVRAIRAF